VSDERVFVPRALRAKEEATAVVAQPERVFVPRAVRVQSEREEKLRFALMAVCEDAHDVREINAKIMSTVAVHVALVHQETEALASELDVILDRAVVAERCLDRMADALAVFEAKCRQGDERGAIDGLREWTRKAAT